MRIVERTEPLVGFNVRQLVRDVSEQAGEVESVDEFEGLATVWCMGCVRSVSSMSFVRKGLGKRQRFRDGAEIPSIGGIAEALPTRPHPPCTKR